MASISKQSNGRRTVQFIAANGKRHSIRLGKASKAHAESVKLRVEQLHAHQCISTAPSLELMRWVQELDDTLYARLAAVGLVAKRETWTLVGMWDAFEASKADVAPSTLLTYKRARNHCLQFFAADRDPRTITAENADAWWAWMKTSRKPHLAEATARKTVSITRQVFSLGIAYGRVHADPTTRLKASVRGNPDRQAWVSPEMTEAVMEALPSVEWRLMFALARWGGLRLPSALVKLRWSDVLWGDGVFIVHAPKTKRHPKGYIRRVPIFPELRPYLEDAFDLAEDGAEFVITTEKYRHIDDDKRSNLGALLNGYIERAGLPTWDKVLNNCRASRSTEIDREYGSKLESKWIGHTEKIAREHYDMVRPEDIERAINAPSKAVQKAVQNPVRHTTTHGGTAPHIAPTCHLQPPNRQGETAKTPIKQGTPGDAENASQWAIQDSNL